MFCELRFPANGWGSRRLKRRARWMQWGIGMEMVEQADRWSEKEKEHRATTNLETRWMGR